LPGKANSYENISLPAQRTQACPQRHYSRCGEENNQIFFAGHNTT